MNTMNARLLSRAEVFVALHKHFMDNNQPTAALLMSEVLNVVYNHYRDGTIDDENTMDMVASLVECGMLVKVDDGVPKYRISLKFSGDSWVEIEEIKTVRTVITRDEGDPWELRTAGDMLAMLEEIIAPEDVVIVETGTVAKGSSPYIKAQQYRVLDVETGELVRRELHLGG